LGAGTCIGDDHDPAVNDIHSIDPIDGGRRGGLGRVSTLLQQLKRTHAPVLMTLGGDYLSPSAVGTAVVDGEPLAGREMVDALNALGLDWAVFGNHEFDLSEKAFRVRLAETRFHIVSSKCDRCERSAVSGHRALGRRAGRRSRPDDPAGTHRVTTDLNRRRTCATHRRSSRPASRLRS
jgi:hypothetical protein